MARNEEYQQDFLWFAYFGITRTEATAGSDHSAAMGQCIRRAYLDLSRRVPYTYSMDTLKKWPKAEREAYMELKRNFKGDVEQRLVDQIAELFREPSLDFDAWHKNLCSRTEEHLSIMEIAASYEGLLSKDFSVGLAQKWVNMTLKNMLVMGLWEEQLSPRRKFLHIPIDSYIISAAHVDLGQPVFEGEQATGLGIKVDIEKWSQIDTYEKYMDYQKAVRTALKGASPIDWEGPAWIAQAKKEKRKEEQET